MEYLDYIYDIYDSYINTYGIIKEDKYLYVATGE